MNIERKNALIEALEEAVRQCVWSDEFNCIKREMVLQKARDAVKEAMR